MVSQLNPLTGTGYGERGEKGARDKVTKRKRGKERVEQGRGPGPLARERGLYLDSCTGVSEFLVKPLLLGPSCILSQGRFEKSIRP